VTGRATSNRVYRWRRQLVIDPAQFEYAETVAKIPPPGTGWWLVGKPS
jgi:hypothetical protein